MSAEHHDQSEISTHAYSGIANRIALDVMPDLDSAAILIPDEHEFYAKPVNQYDRTLSRQLDDLHYDSESITGGLISSPPEAYLFTQASAIPTADAVRGYFKAAGRTLPLLGTIAANSRLSRHHFDQDEAIRPPYSEVERLKELTAGLDHVCVVDQYVADGLTLKYAGILLAYAGVRVRTAVRGNWYNNANVQTDEINADSITSKHADFMRNTGKLAWKNAI